MGEIKVWAHKTIRSKSCRDEHGESALETPRFLRWTFFAEREERPEVMPTGMS